jgi:4-oxalocrotonate tautomerase
MPHVIIKLYPGRTEEQKIELTNKIVQSLKETVNADESSISVSFEEISSEDWGKEVYKPDIIDKEKTLFKRPGYSYSEDELD